MRAKFIFLLLILSSKHGFSLDRISAEEETLIISKEKIEASNCSPRKLGFIDKIYQNGNRKYELLKFVPQAIEGEIICGFTDNLGSVKQYKFRLEKGRNNPVVNITRASKDYEIPHLERFSRFIQGKIEEFEKIEKKIKIITDRGRYHIDDFYSDNLGHVLFKLKFRPFSKISNEMKINTDNLGPILFSFLGEHRNDSEVIYIMARKTSFQKIVESIEGKK